MVNCENCKEKIISTDESCYSRDQCVFFCSLDCFTTWSYDHLDCRSLTTKEIRVT